MNTDGDEKMRARLLFCKWLKDNVYVFEKKPSNEFYKYFYWKSKYYFLEYWVINLKTTLSLVQLRYLCTGKINMVSMLKIVKLNIHIELKTNGLLELGK
jgi:hypothetical protein